MSEPMPPPHTTDNALHRRTLDHVDKEFAWLTSIADTSRQIRAALDNGGAEALAGAVSMQSEAIRRAADMSMERLRWRNEIGACLGIAPERVALSTVAAVIGG